MCGIVGIASISTLSDRNAVTAGRDALSHRGPDDKGEWFSPDGRVGFGHRRLAIIDLSPAGHQPMQDATGELVIVFNGEIYNFQDLRSKLQVNGHCFKTSSDTEVILASYREWGIDCLAQLNGMFAFALFDKRARKLFMARDRAGEKPLYYAIANGTLRFASELKALMADRAFQRRIDSNALDCYLAMGYVPGDLCILQGTKKLPPAHALSFDLETGHSKVWRYWKLPDQLGDCARPEDESILLDELESLLEDSVRRQLIADVPVGVLLSGGVDSSLVTAMAVRTTPKVKTFTVRFPGYAKYDETEHARLIARHFGTEHVELEAADTAIDMLPKLARQFDEPIVDSSMIPTFLVSQLIRQHCTVALGGDGGDELFGGYWHYSRLLWLQRRLGKIPAAVRAPISVMAERALPIGLKGRNWLQGLGADFNGGLPHVASLFDRSARRKLMQPRRSWPLVAEGIREQRIPATKDLLQRATRMDYENYMAEDILVKVDRASMMNSLEIRAPLLDYRLVEFAFAKVPSHMKAIVTGRKVILKKLCSRVLPPAFNQQRKQGFSIPLAHWLQSGPWRNYFQEVLLDSDNSPFDKKFIGGLVSGQANGRSNSERLFSLMLFELWRKEYGATFV